MIELHNPADMPAMTLVSHIEEPRIKATIMVPDDYLGDVLKLCQDRRGIQQELTYAGTRPLVVYDLPLNEVVFDFYDRLKSVTKGYASFDYQITGYRQDNLVKMSILVNDEPVDALSMMVHRDRAEMRGRAMVEKLKDLLALPTPPKLLERPCARLLINSGNGEAICAEGSTIEPRIGRQQGMQHKRHRKHHAPSSLTSFASVRR